MEPQLIAPEGENWLITERIPLTLINPYLNKGPTLVIDNMYTTPRLAYYLLQKSTKVVGTVRPKRKNFAKDFTRGKDIPKGAAEFKHSHNVLAMKYRAAKDKSQGKPTIVHVLSTKHAANMKDTPRQNFEGNVQKPEAIIYYNHKMGGIDTIDQQLHSIQIQRKSYKWYHKIFFRMFMMALLSAHKLYKTRRGKLDFVQFVHEVVTGLVSNAPHLRPAPNRQNDNLVRLTGRHFPTQVPYEGQAKNKKNCVKKCRVCSARGTKSPAGHYIKSTWQCGDCTGNPGLCPGDCFRIYHTKVKYYKV